MSNYKCLFNEISKIGTEKANTLSSYTYDGDYNLILTLMQRNRKTY